MDKNMKEVAPRKELFFKGICLTHNFVVESGSSHVILEALTEHISEQNYKCRGIDIQTFVNGERVIPIIKTLKKEV